MNTAQPIRDAKDLERFKQFYRKEEPNLRNDLLLTLGLNTALRVSDLLELRWRQVYDFEKGAFRVHIALVEQKTGKHTQIFINESILKALIVNKEALEQKAPVSLEQYLFRSQKGSRLSRVQAWRIIRKAAESCNISGVISPHSLRKTFGYYACKQGVRPALLMELFNHSSFEVTKRYLGIDQEDKDEVFRTICI
ncbi:MAG: tyrosine-type recombinase/integrase [Lachnospiraceae bacterium]|nr:tyrosine-type recombinase/integrase [Lachnospiraceae bacterium]MCI9150879.1 tyrosine-type recombinase/integrase [Lachnospiraceae bacterium]